jgi:hypothetical protein
VRTGQRPRVDGAAGRDSLLLASRVLDSIRTHAWEGRQDGPMGPHQVPAPRGFLFNPPVQEAA